MELLVVRVLHGALWGVVVGAAFLEGQEAAVDVSAIVVGGGIRGQAEAVRHGISRALVIINPIYRTSLKKLGYMTRDTYEGIAGNLNKVESLVSAVIVVGAFALILWLRARMRKA